MEEEFHNHMRIPWHDYTRKSIGRPITEASLSEKLPSVRDLAGEAGVNPNTMQRALSALDQDGLTITNRTSGRCVTEDVTKIEECRKDIAHKIVKQYIRNLEELGYNKEDAVALIGKEEEE